MRKLLLGALCAALLAPSTAAAQDAAPMGLWLDVGAGMAGARISCDACRTDRRAGPTYRAAVGGTLRPGLLLGLEGSAWERTQGLPDDEEREAIRSIHAIARLYPRPAGGFWVAAGVGRHWYALEADETTLKAPSYGVLAGLGYDLPLGRWLTLSNHATLSASGLGSLKDGESTLARQVGFSVVRLGVSVVYR